MSNLAVTIDGKSFQVEITANNSGGDEWTVYVDSEPLHVRLSEGAVAMQAPDCLIVGDRPYEIQVDRDLQWVRSQGRSFTVQVHDLDLAVKRPHSRDGRIKAPIPGLVTQILVEPGQQVAVGDTVLTLEAMKMENHILAPFGGIVSSIHVNPGQCVMLKEVLAEITTNQEKRE